MTISGLYTSLANPTCLVLHLSLSLLIYVHNTSTSMNCNSAFTHCSLYNILNNASLTYITSYASVFNFCEILFITCPKLLSPGVIETLRDKQSILENGSHYRASELIPLILGVFKNKIERRRQNKNNRPINLPNVITFSTDFKYTTQS